MDDTDLLDAEFSGTEFENGEAMALSGWPLAACLEQIARELGRDLTDDEASQFRFGWHVGRADYEARVEREAARQWEAAADLPPVAGDPIPF